MIDDGVLFATMTTPTAEVASGDVLADTQQLFLESRGTDPNAMPRNSGSLILVNAQVIDKGDQAPALDIVVLRSNVSLGTENSAPDISDANAVEVLKVINIEAGDYNDMGAWQLAEKVQIATVLQGDVDAKTLYVGLIARETYTPGAASNLVVRLGVMREAP